MQLSRLVLVPLRFRFWRPRHVRLVARELFPAPRPELPHREHLAAAIDWLCHAQSVRDGQPDAGGVSAGWNFEDGWLPSYPETSGYIVETLLAAARALGRPDLARRAGRIIDWELSIQHADGAFPGHFGEPGSRPVIFNTGQIMHGMIAGYRELGRVECLQAAVRAGHWLARHQDDDGCWRRFEYRDIPHTYNTRGTWALAAVSVLAGDETLARSARRNLDWALAQQTPSGWFENNAFTAGGLPVTHTIGYAIRGLLESGVVLGDERYVQAALAAALAVAGVQREDGWIAGTLDRDWRAGAGYCCLTGVAQMAVDWLRIVQEGHAPSLRENARRGIAYLKRRHRVDDPDPIVRGAIAGSAPIWGRYSAFEFPNWAPKFFADALMMDMSDEAVPPVVRHGHATPGVVSHA
jgi:hypothetical protein